MRIQIHLWRLLQKKSEKFKKSVDNYRAREYNIRVLATIAQLAEHLIRNERVVGSNPISGSNKIKASEKSEAFFLVKYPKKYPIKKILC